jgi:hypothetical protein
LYLITLRPLCTCRLPFESLGLRSYTFWCRVSASSGSSLSGEGGRRNCASGAEDAELSEMVEEVLHRQAHYLVERNEMPLEDALVSVVSSEAGRQLRELGEGEHQHEEARYWQANLCFERVTERVRQRRTT